MANARYDISELAKIDGLNAAEAIKNFATYQEYFDRLSDFTENSRKYLRAYTPSVVIYSEEVQKDFWAELKKTQGILIMLGATSIAVGLTYLSDSIYKKDAGILSDRLLKFYAEMDIVTKQIALARVPNAEAASSAAAKEQLIFAVDDKPEILTTLANMLKSKYKVIAMTNGKLALKAMAMHSPLLFLLDIEMPVINGYELAEEIRTNERFKNTPILFLTGNYSRDAMGTALAHGGNDYILKPVNKDTLLNKIELHLKRQGVAP